LPVCFYYAGDHRDLYSFPTRRSSDLGMLVNKEVEAENTTWKFDMNEPMLSYLVALVIGKYDEHKDTSNTGIPLQMYYYPEDSLRSEEHTSELQSRENLVCRLLLEKKN